MINWSLVAVNIIWVGLIYWSPPNKVITSKLVYKNMYNRLTNILDGNNIIAKYKSEIFFKFYLFIIKVRGGDPFSLPPLRSVTAKNF